MSNHKQLGAKDMLRQSIVYLYNSYREEGYDVKQSKDRVAHELEAVYRDYADRGMVNTQKEHRISNPNKVVDSIIQEVEELTPKMAETKFKLSKYAIIQSLISLKKLL